jgi:parallel beta-helix repeat protein
LGVQSGTVIDGNVVKNVFNYGEYMWCIYLDESALDMVVSNNVVYNTDWGSLFQHYDANNTIINNVFAGALLIQQP